MIKYRNIVIFLFIALAGSGCKYEYGSLVSTILPETFWVHEVSTYGIMMALGFITANFLLQKEFHRLGFKPQIADNLILLVAAGGILGAKIFFVWEISSEWSGWEGFRKNFFTGAGLTWYGGMVVATLFGYLYLRKVKIPFFRVADIGTPALAIGYMFGRLGCLVSGDGCYGTACPYDLPAPLAMAFPNGAARSVWLELEREFGPDVVVYNTPFYEAFFSFALFLYFYKIRETEWPIGVKVVTYVFLHSIFRFLVELIRLNPRDVFGVTQAQFLSIILVAVSIGYYIYKRKEIIQSVKG